MSLLTEFFTVSDELLGGQIDALAVVFDHPADDLGAPAVALQNAERCVAIPFGDENAKADPHIVDFEHFCRADGAALLDQAENRRRIRQIVDLEADCPRDAREIKKAISRNVDQCFYARHLVDDVEDFRDVNQSRSKQLVPERNLKLVEDVANRQFGALEECLARQSQTVAMNAAAFEAYNNVTGRQVT